MRCFGVEPGRPQQRVIAALGTDPRVMAMARAHPAAAKPLARYTAMERRRED